MLHISNLDFFFLLATWKMFQFLLLIPKNKFQFLLLIPRYQIHFAWSVLNWCPRTARVNGSLLLGFTENGIFSHAISLLLASSINLWIAVGTHVTSNQSSAEEGKKLSGRVGRIKAGWNHRAKKLLYSSSLRKDKLLRVRSSEISIAFWCPTTLASSLAV